jgi:hypothetical protein
MTTLYGQFKQRLAEIKVSSFDLAVKHSEECWTVKDLRHKGPFNTCTKAAVLPYAIYRDGKRRLRLKKQQRLKECGEDEECRRKLIGELLEDLTSLEQRIDLIKT